MKGSPTPPRAAKIRARIPTDAPPSTEQAKIDLRDPEQARAWLGAMRDAAEDLAAAAREGTRRLKKRVLSRAEIKRKRREAERSVRGLLDAADAALIAM